MNIKNKLRTIQARVLQKIKDNEPQKNLLVLKNK